MSVARDEARQGWAGISPPPWASQKAGGRAGRGDKPQLSREAIVAAAMRIVDTEGLDAVSMRRVAQEFGTGAASLYAYVANKEELLDLIFDWIMGEVADRWPGTAPTAENWRELVKDSLRISYQVLVGHRDVARVFQGRIPFGPNGLRMVEAQLAILRAGGVPDQIAAFAGDLFGQFVVSSVVEHGMWNARYPDADPSRLAEEMAQIRDYLAALPKELFPNTVELAGPMMNQEPEGFDRFELGLEVIVRGIASFVTAPLAGTAAASSAAEDEIRGVVEGSADE
jgi:TetR/AcrR family transcriptional regulator, tetracycline repressor protein